MKHVCPEAWEITGSDGPAGMRIGMMVSACDLLDAGWRLAIERVRGSREELHARLGHSSRTNVTSIMVLRRAA